MAQPERARRKAPEGVASPRLAPPTPAKSRLSEYEAAAKDLDIDPMAWQKMAARYLTATAPSGRWLYRDFVAVAARQNGKTTFLLPRIYMGLRNGERMLHTAQNRAIPRETFLSLARALNGRPGVQEIRFANGQELIRYQEEGQKREGRYTLVAPRPGVRGHSDDIVFLDEVREQHSFDLLASIKPTLTASQNPQIIYLSNAGDSDSIVLNDLRRRAESDTALCYLEWSAAPERSLDDPLGWAEANPALGITIQYDTLQDFRRSLPAAVFETEHLCRWVVTMQPRLITVEQWEACRDHVEKPTRPMLGINMDPSGTRASAVAAWQQSDGTVAIEVVAHVTGSPIDTDAFGKALSQRALRLGVTQVAYGAWTDGDIARYFRKPVKLDGREYANASENFVRLAESRRIRWQTAEQVGEDIGWTSRKPHESGAWQAVRAQEEHPATAALAAIRAVWLASGPKPAAPRVL